MIISKCPLRISLAGGSTDLQEFLNKYKYGSVISFSINLSTYIIINARRKHGYRTIYSHIEDTNKIEDIKNDIVRETFLDFQKRNILIPPMEIIFESDIPSFGSGLASSTSYTIALVNAINTLLNIKISNIELCNIALKIERQFNPLTGYQDVFGCAFPSLKRINFSENGLLNIIPLLDTCLNRYTMYLIPTASVRCSTSILNTLDLEKCFDLLSSVESLWQSLNNGNSDLMCNIINEAWEKKKITSSYIINDSVLNVENYLSQFSSIHAKRLCGAGGGGYFFILTNQQEPEFEKIGYKIKINHEGIVTTII